MNNLPTSILHNRRQFLITSDDLRDLSPEAMASREQEIRNVEDILIDRSALDEMDSYRAFT